MAKLSAAVELHVKTRYKVFFLPVATYERLGDLATFRIIGVAIWYRIGNLCSLLGVTYTRKKERGNDNG